MASGHEGKSSNAISEVIWLLYFKRQHLPAVPCLGKKQFAGLVTQLKPNGECAMQADHPYMSNKSWLLLIGLCISLLLAGPVSAASCKGMSQSKCESAGSCSWVRGYTTKTGSKVKGYCRSKPSKSSTNNKNTTRKSTSAEKDKARKSATTNSGTDKKKTGKSKSNSDNKDKKGSAKKSTSSKPANEKKKSTKSAQSDRKTTNPKKDKEPRKDKKSDKDKKSSEKK